MRVEDVAAFGRGKPVSDTGRDVISLDLPHAPGFVHVARMVVGGLAARLDLAYDSADDLQLAVEAVLARPELRIESHVTVDLELTEDLLTITIGPLDPGALEADLDRQDEFGLGVLLSALINQHELVHRPRGTAILMRKDMPVRSAT
jgi:hypothetical protein